MAEGKIQKASVEVRRAVKMNRTEYPVALMSVREQLLNKSEQEVIFMGIKFHYFTRKAHFTRTDFHG